MPIKQEYFGSAGVFQQLGRREDFDRKQKVFPGSIAESSHPLVPGSAIAPLPVAV